MTYGERSRGVEGVLWAHFDDSRVMTDAGPAPYTSWRSRFTRNDLRALGNSYGSGHAMYEWSNGHHQESRLLARMPTYCLPPCGLLRYNWLDDLINPADRLRGGLVGVGVEGPVPGLDPVTLDIFRSVEAGERLLVEAGDWRARAERGVVEQTAMVLHRESGMVEGLTMLDEPEGQHRFVALEGLGAVPEWVPGRGLAFGDTLDKLYAFGGTEGAEPLLRAAVLDLNAGDWIEIDLGGEAIPGRVLAASYSAHHEAVWFLREAEEAVELGRWRVGARRAPGENLEVLARLPAAWNGANGEGSFRVAIGPDHRIVASWARPSGGVVAFGEGPENDLVVLGLGQSGDATIERLPVPTRAGLAYVERLGSGLDSTLRMDVVRWADLDVDAIDLVTVY